MEDYMSFMISRETENIQSLSEVEGAFRAITANGDKPYVTIDEIFQVRHSWLVSCQHNHMSVIVQILLCIMIP